MSSTPQTEVWQRGPVDGFDPTVMPVVHSLLQVREDAERLVGTVTPAAVWERPGGAASIGFHLRHTGGALDRLFTYARGEMLNTDQRAYLATEQDPGQPPATLRELVDELNSTIERALAQLRDTAPSSLLDTRRVGRAGLPSTVMGLLFHAAEHSTRHIGQAITTARILSGMPRS
jgi:uncharacterized damage-inducible protein DinB